MPEIKQLTIADDLIPALDQSLSANTYRYEDGVLSVEAQDTVLYPVRDFTFGRFHGVIFDIGFPYDGPSFRMYFFSPDFEVTSVATLNSGGCSVDSGWVGDTGDYGSRSDSVIGSFRYVRFSRNRYLIEGFTGGNDYIFVDVSNDKQSWTPVAMTGEMLHPGKLDDSGWNLYFEFNGNVNLGPILGVDVPPYALASPYDFKLRTPAGWESVATPQKPINLRLPDNTWAVLNNRTKVPGPKLYVRQGSNWLFVASAGNDPNWRLNTIAQHSPVPDPANPNGLIAPGAIGGMNDYYYENYYRSSSITQTSQYSNISYNGGFTYSSDDAYQGAMAKADTSYSKYDTEAAKNFESYPPPVSYYAKDGITQRIALLDLGNYTAWLNNYYPEKEFYTGIYKPLSTMKLKRIQIAGNLTVSFLYTYFYDGFAGRTIPTSEAQVYSRSENVQLVNDVAWSIYALPHASGAAIAPAGETVDNPYNPRYPTPLAPYGERVLHQVGIQAPPGYFSDPGNNGHTAYRPFVLNIEDPGDAVKLTVTAELPNKDTADSLTASASLGVVSIKLIYATDGHDAPASTLKPSRGLGTHTGFNLTDTFNLSEYLGL